MGIEGFDQFDFYIIFRDRLCLAHIACRQQNLCKAIVCERTVLLIYLFVHLGLSHIGNRPCVRHFFRFLAHEPVIFQCFFILAQSQISFRTTHVRLNVVRVEPNRLGKGCYRLGIVQFR